MIPSLQKLEGNRALFRVDEVGLSTPDRQNILEHSEKIGKIETWEYLADGKIAYYVRFEDGQLLKIIQNGKI